MKSRIPINPTPEELKQMGELLSKFGVHGDTVLAHISPQEAKVLKAMGGEGTKNPKTGLVQFYDSDGLGNNDGGGASDGFGGNDGGTDAGNESSSGPTGTAPNDSGSSSSGPTDGDTNNGGSEGSATAPPPEAPAAAPAPDPAPTSAPPAALPALNYTNVRTQRRQAALQAEGGLRSDLLITAAPGLTSSGLVIPL